MTVYKSERSREQKKRQLEDRDNSIQRITIRHTKEEGENVYCASENKSETDRKSKSQTMRRWRK